MSYEYKISQFNSAPAVPDGWRVQHVPDGFIRVDTPDGRSTSVARGPDAITSTTYDFFCHFAAAPTPTDGGGD